MSTTRGRNNKVVVGFEQMFVMLYEMLNIVYTMWK